MCCNKSINLINGSGGINTLYSADGSLLANRTVTMGGNNLVLNGTQDLTYTDAGRLTLSLYLNSLDDTVSGIPPDNFLYTNGAGQVMSAPNHMGGMLPVNAETSGVVTVQVNHLTPINVSVSGATVTPPTGVSTSEVFEITDSRANASTNNILIDFSGAGETFHGALQNFTINSDAGFARFRFLGSPIGWIVEK